MNSSIEDGSFWISFAMFSSVSSSPFSITLFVASSSIMSAVSFRLFSNMSATFSASGEYVVSSVFQSDASIICCSAWLYPCCVFSLSLYVSFTHLSFGRVNVSVATTHHCVDSGSLGVVSHTHLLLRYLSHSACFCSLILAACLSINICVASSNSLSISACVFHSAIFDNSLYLSISPFLKLAFVFQSTFRASTYWLYKSRSSLVLTALVFSAFHNLSKVVNPSDPRTNPHRHPTVDANITHAYLIQFHSHTRVCLYCVFAFIVLLTISGDCLVSSTNFFIPGRILSIWSSVSSSRFSI